VAAGPGGLGQQRREAQHPPVDGDVVDLDTAFDQEFFDVAVRQAEAEIPAHRDEITSGGKRKPAKADRGTGVRRGRWVLMPPVSPQPRRRSQRNSPVQRNNATVDTVLLQRR
jgi:hypothetical protein